MNMKRILSTALLVVMLFSTVICAFPMGINAAYSTATNSGTVRVPEGVEEANLTEEQLAAYYEEILKEYTSERFSSVEEVFDYEYNKGYLYYTNAPGNTHTIYVNKYTGVIYYVNNVTGQMLSSNVVAPADLGGEEEKAISMSQINLNFFETKNPQDKAGKTDFNSFKQAVSRGQISVNTIKGGFRVNYTLGDTTTRFLLPGQLTAEAFEENILIPMFERFEEMLNEDERCAAAKKYKEQYSFFDNISYEQYKNGVLNSVAKDYGYKLYLKDMENMMKACYPTAKDKATPEYQALRSLLVAINTISQAYTARNPAAIDLSKHNGQKELEELYEKYPITKDGIVIYEYTGSSETATKRSNANLIKKNCPNYTFSIMYEHEREVGYVETIEEKPVFRCALEYTFNNDGSLNVSLPANSIMFDETVYTLECIMPLQYFGGLDMRDSGYFFHPDGSGAVIDFDNIYNEVTQESSSIKSPVYGLDYSYSSLTDIQGISHRAQVTMPVYGAVTEREATSKTAALYEVETVTDGFFAIVEEGASLATLMVDGKVPYIASYARFNPRPADTIDLSQSLSVGSLGDLTIVSEAKYTGSFTTRYVMLTDDAIGEATYGKDAYYASDYVGMASYYRDYLKDMGVLTQLENISESMPLYLEVLGAMDITTKFLSFPVTESIPLTTFDDIALIYEQLSECETYVIKKVAEYRQLAAMEEDDVQKYQYEYQAQRYEELIGQITNIKNINFKMSGFANGGMNATYPAKLKWAKACGGKDGYSSLVATANDISAAQDASFNLYPDFDFMYINRTDSFDGISIKKIASKMVDNRYASMQVYNSVKQGFETVITYVVSSDAIDELYSKFNSKYSEYGNKRISVSTMGSDLNSNFDEENAINREQSLANIVDILDTMANVNDYDVMVDTGNIYTIQYANHIINASIDSSHHRAASYTVPFLGLVLHSYVNYTGQPVNYSGSSDYDLLRAIENGASLYYILCYQNTSFMKDDELLSKYYGVDYINWFDEIVENYAYLNSMIGDLQAYEIYDHEILIAERVIEEEEFAANFKKLEAEILGFLEAQIIDQIDEKLLELKGNSENYSKRIKFVVDSEALYARFADILNVSVDELKADHSAFVANVDALIAKYETEYAGASDASNNVTVSFEEFIYGTGEFCTKYTYITDSLARDKNYVKTDYTIDNGNISMVTYRNGDDTVRFIINYNSFNVDVRLSETETYALSAYGCIRLD